MAKTLQRRQCTPRHHLAPGYTRVGPWAWDNNRLLSKINTEPDVNGCLNWQGSMSGTGALMGAWKNGVQQMTQARRLLWMSVNRVDATPYQITMTCANQQCVNIQHFKLKPTNRPDAGSQL